MSDSNPATALLEELRGLAFKGLPRMYREEEGIHAFRVRRSGSELMREGRSARYTAIALIGLATESDNAARSALRGDGPDAVCSRLLKGAASWDNLGDVALTLWASCALGVDGDIALRRLMELRPDALSYPTVELAWALSALCAAGGSERERLARLLAERLMRSLRPPSWVFPHIVGDQAGSRSHVACFADLVYPIQALALLHTRFGDEQALTVASDVARHLRSAQGPAGQWWWHYDVRTGGVIEGYPVYAIHQDAMGPMALLALREAGGPDFSDAIAKGLAWLASSPELDGGSLIDRKAGIVWRKVARREPRKTTRYLRAAASRIHPAARLRVLDRIFPPGSIDFEDRPYHLGWLLHAWTPSRMSGWQRREAQV